MANWSTDAASRNSTLPKAAARSLPPASARCADGGDDDGHGEAELRGVGCPAVVEPRAVDGGDPNVAVAGGEAGGGVDQRREFAVEVDVTTVGGPRSVWVGPEGAVHGVGVGTAARPQRGERLGRRPPAAPGVEDDGCGVEHHAVEQVAEKSLVDLRLVEVQPQRRGTVLELGDGGAAPLVTADDLADVPTGTPAGGGSPAHVRRESGQAGVGDVVVGGVQRLDRDPVVRRRAQPGEVAGERQPVGALGRREPGHQGLGCVAVGHGVQPRLGSLPGRSGERPLQTSTPIFPRWPCGTDLPQMWGPAWCSSADADDRRDGAVGDLDVDAVGAQIHRHRQVFTVATTPRAGSSRTPRRRRWLLLGQTDEQIAGRSSVGSSAQPSGVLDGVPLVSGTVASSECRSCPARRSGSLVDGGSVISTAGVDVSGAALVVAASVATDSLLSSSAQAAPTATRASRAAARRGRVRLIGL